MKPEQRLQLEELATKLVTPERFLGAGAVQGAVEPPTPLFPTEAYLVDAESLPYYGE